MLENKSLDEIYNFYQEWQFWVIFCRYVDKVQYEIEPIIKVRSLSKFAEYHSSLPEIKQLRNTQNGKISLAFFSENIKPAWEDAANKDGGCLLIFLSDKLKEKVQDVWEYLLAAAASGRMNKWIAGNIQDNYVCGIIVAPKAANSYAFEIWLRGPPKNANYESFIINKLKAKLDIDIPKLTYKSHLRKGK